MFLNFLDKVVVFGAMDKVDEGIVANVVISSLSNSFLPSVIKITFILVDSSNSFVCIFSSIGSTVVFVVVNFDLNGFLVLPCVFFVIISIGIVVVSSITFEIMVDSDSVDVINVLGRVDINSIEFVVDVRLDGSVINGGVVVTRGNVVVTSDWIVYIGLICSVDSGNEDVVNDDGNIDTSAQL